VKLSTKGRYGSRAILDLALHSSGADDPVLLRDIAKRQDISDKYLEHVFATLRKGGLVRGVRGAKGGYLLAKDPAKIKLSEIIELLEGPINIVECVGNKKVCKKIEFCITRDIWSDVKKAIYNVLDNITLKEMIERGRKWQGNQAKMYYI
jgi:Rrf2 family transcriptional regulator, cysteine metabolism repressor